MNLSALALPLILSFSPAVKSPPRRREKTYWRVQKLAVFLRSLKS
jgi:hypothetical protein